MIIQFTIAVIPLTMARIQLFLKHRTKICCVWKKWVRRKETHKTRNLRKKIEVAFSWGLQRVVVRKSLFDSVLPPSPSWGDSSFVIAACWYFPISRIVDRLGVAWIGCPGPLLNLFRNLLWTPKSRYLISYIAIWWINSKVPEGSMNASENNSLARESSPVMILKSRLNSRRHSARMR